MAQTPVAVSPSKPNSRARRGGDGWSLEARVIRGAQCSRDPRRTLGGRSAPPDAESAAAACHSGPHCIASGSTRFRVATACGRNLLPFSSAPVWPPPVPIHGQVTSPAQLTVERVAALPSIIGTAPASPTWSPDSRMLAFRWNDAGWPFRDLWLVAADGTGLRRADRSPAHASAAAAAQPARLPRRWRRRPRPARAAGSAKYRLDAATVAHCCSSRGATCIRWTSTAGLRASCRSDLAISRDHHLS